MQLITQQDIDNLRAETERLWKDKQEAEAKIEPIGDAWYKSSKALDLLKLRFQMQQEFLAEKAKEE